MLIPSLINRLIVDKGPPLWMISQKGSMIVWYDARCLILIAMLFADISEDHSYLIRNLTNSNSSSQFEVRLSQIRKFDGVGLLNLFFDSLDSQFEFD